MAAARGDSAEVQRIVGAARSLLSTKAGRGSAIIDATDAVHSMPAARRRLLHAWLPRVVPALRRCAHFPRWLVGCFGRGGRKDAPRYGTRRSVGTCTARRCAYDAAAPATVGEVY